MFADTEGIVLKQVKTASGRRMITILTRRWGKISCGTSINEGGKTKAALALRPFSIGRYDIYKNRDLYNISAADLLQSFFGLGEDMDRFMNASYALELTDRILEEEQVSPAFYELVCAFLPVMEKRKKAFGTLVIAFQMKVLAITGCAPVLDRCVRSGKTEDLVFFSVADGGVISADTMSEHDRLDPLIFPVSADVVQALSYISSHPVARLENLALNPQVEKTAGHILKACLTRYLGISDLKSEGLKI